MSRGASATPRSRSASQRLNMEADRDNVRRLSRPFLNANGHALIVRACRGAAATALASRDPNARLISASVAQDSAKRLVGNVTPTPCK